MLVSEVPGAGSEGRENYGGYGQPYGEQAPPEAGPVSGAEAPAPGPWAVPPSTAPSDPQPASQPSSPGPSYPQPPAQHGGPEYPVAPVYQTPQSGPPYPGAPQSGPPYPGAPQSGPPYGGVPQSGPPYAPAPQSGPPYAGAPQSGPPYGGVPQSGPPYPETPQPAQPVDSWSMFPNESAETSWQPRIVPSPKPPRGRVLLGIAVGLLAGLVLFGPTGYLVGAHRAESAPPKPQSSSPGTGDALGPFEQNQRALNTNKFNGDLAVFAKSWLPHVANCNKSGDKDGPQLGQGEVVRISCRYASVTVFFVQFQSIEERDRARGGRVPQNEDAKQMMPGVGEAAAKRTASGNANGNYLEYGFKGDTGRTFAGLWWDNTATPVAGFMIVDWNDGLDEKWEPLRDLWRRYS